MATTAGLSSALSSALTGINASKQVLSTLSNNIANANTDGYTRKIVTVSNNIVAGEGHGVKVDNITR